MSEATDDAQFDQCEQCNAPVDRDQRYCVNCGTHRRHVPDPAARYMSRVSAHTGTRAGGVAGAVAGGAVVKGAPAVEGISRFWTGGVSLLGALAIALIPVAAAIGVVVGHSSSGSNTKLDSKLIAALESQRGGTTQTVVSNTAAPASSSSSSSAGTETVAKQAAKKTAKTKTAASTSKTSNGTATKVTGAKVTAKERSQGSQEAQKIQKSTGKSYVQGSSNLPSQVVVGP